LLKYGLVQFSKAVPPKSIKRTGWPAGRWRISTVLLETVIFPQLERRWN